MCARSFGMKVPHDGCDIKGFVEPEKENESCAHVSSRPVHFDRSIVAICPFFTCSRQPAGAEQSIGPGQSACSGRPSELFERQGFFLACGCRSMERSHAQLSGDDW